MGVNMDGVAALSAAAAAAAATNGTTTVLVGNAGQTGTTVVGTGGGSQNGSSGSGRSTPSSSDSSPGKLFVGGLSWQTTPEKLREYFSQFGEVTDVLVMKDPVTQRSRGFGFITFSAPDAVERVLTIPVHTLDGKKIDPKHATPKSKSKANKTKKIFVGGVSQETSAEEVKAYFSNFGKVEEAVMLMDQQTKRHRGFGFVTFENEDVVDRVCEIHFHTIKNKKVECKKAQPKEAVQAANTAALLGKRVILNNLGISTGQVPGSGLSGIPGLTATQASVAALAAAQGQAAALNAGYGKLLNSATGLPTLSSFRYAPYPVPSAMTASQAVQQAQAQAAAALAAQQQHQAAAAAAAAQHASSPNNPAVSHHQQQSNIPTLTAAGVQFTTSHAGVIPSVTATGAGGHNPNGVTAQQLQAAAAAAAVNAPSPAVSQGGGNPYQGYNLANVDMSSFQGIDWSSVYGMGMYV